MSTTPVPARHLAAVAVGGAIGSLARVAFATAFPPVPGQLPWVTLVENLGGTLALAFVLTWLTERVRSDPMLRLAVCTGMLGAFTTYSTLTVELGGLLTGGHVLVAVGYAAGSLSLGVLGAVTGIRLARRPPGTHRSDQRAGGAP